jgi:hypothetical protein
LLSPMELNALSPGVDVEEKRQCGWANTKGGRCPDLEITARIRTAGMPLKGVWQRFYRLFSSVCGWSRGGGGMARYVLFPSAKLRCFCARICSNEGEPDPK